MTLASVLFTIPLSNSRSYYTRNSQYFSSKRFL